MAVDKVLHCGLVNIQSVGNKTINIRNLINEARFDIFMLTETWLWGDASDSFKIKEMTPKAHTFYHFPRVEKTGGGVGIFVSKSFSRVTVRNQLIFNTFEYIDLEILSKNKVIRLITVYRPPTISGKRKEKEFIEEFGNYLDTGCPFFWREIWQANFLIEKRHYMPSAEGARRQARGSGVSSSSPSGVSGSAPETKHFYAF